MFDLERRRDAALDRSTASGAAPEGATGPPMAASMPGYLRHASSSCTAPGGLLGPAAPSPFAGMFDDDTAGDVATSRMPRAAGLFGLTLGADREAHEVLIGLARELAASGKQREIEAHRQTAFSARVSDGMVDRVEGQALRERSHELGMDRMSFPASMYAAGLDPAAVHMLQEKCRGIDPASSVTQGVSHNDHTGAPLGHFKTLSDDEQRLIVESQSTRRDDLHTDYTTSSGLEVPASRLRKVIDVTQSKELATGKRNANGTVGPADTVGGFLSMASHFDGLSAAGSLQMAGLDSNWHASPTINYFDKTTNDWTPQAAGPNGSLTMLDFPLTPDIEDVLRVPYGTDVHKMMQGESHRRLGNQNVAGSDGRILSEYIPELLEPQRDKETGEARREDPRDPQSMPRLKNAEVLDRGADDDTNPYGGFGVSHTRRATNPAGGMLPVIDNQELMMQDGQRRPIPPTSELVERSPTGTEKPLASLGTGAPILRTSDPAKLGELQVHLNQLAQLRPGP